VSYDMLYEILHSLETGIVSLQLDLKSLRFMNNDAEAVLRDFGSSGRPLPDQLHSIVRTSLEATSSGRFSRAVLATAPSGRAYYLRVKRLPRSAIIVISSFVPREHELAESLRREFGLSQRECTIVKGVRDGLRNDEIAERMSVSVGTVKQHLNRVFVAVGVRSRTQLIAALERIAASVRSQ